MQKGVVVGSALSSEERTRVLQLLYRYQHLDGRGLDDLPSTDLVVHRIRLADGMKPVASRYQKRWSAPKEWWLQKLVSDGIRGGIYEPTLRTSEHLSPWNSRPVLVDKGENPMPTDEPQLTFDYSQIQEVIPGLQMELAEEVHSFLENPEHQTFIQADLKHAYYSITLHPEDRPI